MPPLSLLLMLSAPAEAARDRAPPEFGFGVAGTASSVEPAAGVGQTWSAALHWPVSDEVALGPYLRRSGFTAAWDGLPDVWEITAGVGLTAVWTPGAADRVRLHGFAGWGSRFTLFEGSPPLGMGGARVSWDLGALRNPPTPETRTHLWSLGVEAFAHLGPGEHAVNGALVCGVRRRRR